MPIKATTPAPEVLKTCDICQKTFALGKWANRNRRLCDDPKCQRVAESQAKAAYYRRSRTPKPELKPMLLGGHADEPERAA